MHFNISNSNSYASINSCVSAVSIVFRRYPHLNANRTGVQEQDFGCLLLSPIKMVNFFYFQHTTSSKYIFGSVMCKLVLIWFTALKSFFSSEQNHRLIFCKNKFRLLFACQIHHDHPSALCRCRLSGTHQPTFVPLHPQH